MKKIFLLILSLFCLMESARSASQAFEDIGHRVLSRMELNERKKYMIATHFLYLDIDSQMSQIFEVQDSEARKGNSKTWGFYTSEATSNENFGKNFSYIAGIDVFHKVFQESQARFMNFTP